MRRREWLTWIPVLALAVFQVLMTTQSNLESGGIVYYLGYDNTYDATHTMTAPVGHRLTTAITVMIVIETLITWYCIRRHVTGVITIMCLVAVLLTVSICYQTYTLPPNGSLKHCRTILAGLAALAVGVCIARWATRIPARYRSAVLWTTLIAMAAFTMTASVYGFGHRVNGAGGYFLGLTTADLYKVFVLAFLSLALPELQQDQRLRSSFFALCCIMVATLVALNSRGDAIILAAIILVAVLQSLGGKVFTLAAAGLSASGIAAYAYIRAASPDSYVVQRVQSTFTAATDATANSNFRRSLLAVLYRGIFGSGTGDTRLIQTNFASRNDYAFSSGVAGIFGVGIALLVLLCIALLPIVILVRTGECRHDVHLYSLSTMSATYLLCQGILHIGSDLNILPLTGVTLPFISTGGTAMVTCFLALGLAVGRRLPSPCAVCTFTPGGALPDIRKIGTEARNAWMSLRRQLERLW
jgi:cell division protein FtsW